MGSNADLIFLRGAAETELTSTTPGTDFRFFSMTQSSMDLNSITSYAGIGAVQRVEIDLADRAPVRPDLSGNAVRQSHLRKSLKHSLAIPKLVVSSS